MGRGVGAEQVLAINPFRVLGLGPDATLEDVKRQYRRLAKEQHSDVVPGASDMSFQALSKARSMLDTEEKLARQKRLWGGPARRGASGQPSRPPRPAPRPRGEHTGRAAPGSHARPAATATQAPPSAPVVPTPSAPPQRPAVTYTRTGAVRRPGASPLVDVTA
jgi:curved DNA-binding protein CbpA